MALALVARNGRHRQLYDEQYRRLVAGCIPYRLIQNGEDPTGDLVDRLEVLMISSPNRLDLVFPKGGWEDDETVDEAACREALEEAGVRGIIHKTLLGTWEFRSKSRQNSCSSDGTCKGFMFALEVTEELECWPERAVHERRWVSVREAQQLCRYEWMRDALDACIRVLSGRPPSPVTELPESSSYFCMNSAVTKHLDNPINALC